jgi:hypothetical protein
VIGDPRSAIEGHEDERGDFTDAEIGRVIDDPGECTAAASQEV